ncbi:MAG: PorP/SprF family type IX secretion system membrane protein [Haliscomenobacter sp.]
MEFCTCWIKGNARVVIMPVLFLLGALGLLNAQQLTPFTLYRDQWSLVNPAAPSNNYILTEYPYTISASSRFQYLGLGSSWIDAPNTQVLNGEWVRDDMNSTFGGQIVSDRTGLIGNIGFYGQYAYRLRLSLREEKFLAIGLGAGMMNYYSRINGGDFPIPDPDIQPVSVWAPDFNIGFFYYNEDSYYLGLSFPQLLGGRIHAGQADPASASLLLNRPRHIYGVAGVYIPFDFFGLGDETALLDISAWLRYVPGALPQLDGNIRYQHNQTFWVGTGVSTSGVSHVEVGFLAGKTIGLFDNQIKISLAYDLPFFTAVSNLGSAFEASMAFSWY